jgi:hypothetical protein
MLLTVRIGGAEADGAGPTWVGPAIVLDRGGVAVASPSSGFFSTTALQLVAKHPGVMFFSAAYFAAVSLTMGAITLSSLVYQSDVIFQFLPSQA